MEQIFQQNDDFRSGETMQDYAIFLEDSDRGNLLCSRDIPIGLLNLITYIQISLLDKIFDRSDTAWDDGCQLF